VNHGLAWRAPIKCARRKIDALRLGLLNTPRKMTGMGNEAARLTMRGKRETPSERAFAAKHCDNPGAIAKYLNGALSTGDPVLITKAIGDMVRAQGVSESCDLEGLIFRVDNSSRGNRRLRQRLGATGGGGCYRLIMPCRSSGAN
jgi:hypothetical protein